MEFTKFVDMVYVETNLECFGMFESAAVKVAATVPPCSTAASPSTRVLATLPTADTLFFPFGTYKLAWETETATDVISWWFPWF